MVTQARALAFPENIRQCVRAAVWVKIAGAATVAAAFDELAPAQPAINHDVVSGERSRSRTGTRTYKLLPRASEKALFVATYLFNAAYLLRKQSAGPAGDRPFLPDIIAEGLVQSNQAQLGAS